MIKATLLALLIGCALSAVTLSTSSTNNATWEWAANSSNSSNYDVTLAFNTGAITAAQEHVVYCVDVALSNYTLSADATNLNTFGWEISSDATTWSGTLTSNFTTGTVAYTHSGTVYTATVTALASPTGVTTSSTATSAKLVFSGVTPTQLTTMKMPNGSNTVYCKTFAHFGVAAADYNSADLSASSAVEGNATLTSYTIATGAVALAGLAYAL